MKPPETQTQQNSGAPDLSTPSSDGLVSASMYASATSTEPTVPEPQPRPSEPVAADMEARSGFITSVHQYIRDNIQFADQKAAFFFAGTTALLALLYKLEVASRWLKPILAWNIVDLASMVAVGGLGVGSMFALAVVVPRLPGSRRGMIFWEAITQFQTARQYADDVAQLSHASLTQNLAEHCYDLALVCKRKYRLLRWSIVASAIGTAACVFLFVFTSPPADEKPVNDQPAASATK